jgi:hypothetical protein
MEQNAPGIGRRKIILVAAFVVLAAWPACAQLTLTLTGSDWSLSASSADLTPPGPGLDFAASYREWTTSDAQISITGTGGASPWSVTAGVRVPPGQSWPAAVSVWVIRTGDGSCTGTCGGAQMNGVLNTPIGPLPTEPTEIAFFDGRRDRVNVPVRLRIEGLTATIPAGTYQIEVVYTVQ